MNKRRPSASSSLKRTFIQVAVGAVFVLFTVLWNLYFQYEREHERFLEKTYALQYTVTQQAQKIEEELKALIQYPQHSTFNFSTYLKLLETTQKLNPGIYSLGLSRFINKNRLKAYQQSRYDEGFEKCQTQPLPLKPIVLSSQKAADAQTSKTLILVTDTLYPYTPEVQSLICKRTDGLFAQAEAYPFYKTLLIQSPHTPSPLLTLFAPLKIPSLAASYGNQVLFAQIDLQQFILHNLPDSARESEQIHLTFDATPSPNTPLQTRALTNTIAPALLTLYTFKREIPFTVLHQPVSLSIQDSWLLSDLKFYSLLLSLLIGLGTYLIILFLLNALRRRYQELKIYQDRLQQLQSKSHDALIITDEGGHIVSWSPHAATLFQYSENETLGKDLFELLNPSLAHRDPKKTLQRLSSSNSPTEIHFTNRNGERLYTEVNVTPIELDNQVEYFFFIQDITQQKRQADRIEQLAFYDPLTGLENRSLFHDNVEQLLKNEKDLQASLFFLDLDGFKQINDTMGHQAGDELLKVIAQRLRGFIQKNDRYHHIARFGGDEFLLFFPYCHEERVTQLAERILQSLQRPVHISQGTVSLSASIGIACYPEDGETLEALQRHADSAMYAAKDKGKNTYAFYDSTMEEHLNERFALENQLKKAIPQNELFLVYQPKIDAQTLQISGFEALIRWINPDLGFVPPDKFIAIAEGSNLILQIGDFVIDAAIAQLQAWKNHPHFHDRPIAINVSSKQIITPDFFKKLQAKLEAAQLSPQHLELELTERSLMSNASEHLCLMQEAESYGFRFAIDDFGTGYSSLSYLKRLPIHTLKVDKSFVDGLPNDDEDRAIARTIIALAQSLKLHTVAEGVETKEQCAWLPDQGCETIQGYYFARPQKPAELEEWWQEHWHTYLNRTGEPDEA